MATVNPFDLLGDDDNDDPTQLIAAQQQKIASATKKAAPAAAGAAPASGKLPTKPLPPSQAVREAKSNFGAPRGGGGGRGGPGRGRGGRGGVPFQDRDSGNGNANGFAGNYGGGGYGGGGYGGSGAGAGGEEGGNRERAPYGGPRQPFRGGPRRGGYGNVDGETGGDPERPRRTYERRSGTGRGNEVKRDGAGRGNWGSATDDAFQQETEENVNVDEKVVVNLEKQTENDPPSAETGKETKEGQENEAEKEEDKEMTLEEYEKIREEKRKALLALKAEERKVEIDKELKSMQQLSLKKGNDEIFIKLGSDKEKKKETADRDEKVKKSLSINEFLKPAEGERYYSPGGRGRGRGRGERGPFRGGFGAGGTANVASAPPIEDPGHFPTLGGK
ncbi:RGG repeats nuclear RNA binding protein A-like [Iris pallida]|uniref:RGG repeats nuclear RNA binding protein A-like n=1 Tax=Iris pallida TaxID=29817 RepID=A0AAX6FIN5_IRIPA|nr:RGG repeats nuclear RNA binding protein A-like [Iris pallida]